MVHMASLTTRNTAHESFVYIIAYSYTFVNTNLAKFVFSVVIYSCV